MAERRAEEQAAEKAEEAQRAVMLDGTQRPPRKVLSKVAIGVIALLTLATAALARRPVAPDLAPDCEKPGFQLATPARQNRPIAYTVVGPAEKRYMLALNTAGFTRSAEGRWLPVVLPGRSRDDVVYEGDQPMTGCLRSGVLSLPVPLGEQVVTLYELGEGPSATEVARQTIDVVPPEEHDLTVPR